MLRLTPGRFPKCTGLKFTIMSSVVRWSKHIDYSLPPLTKGLCRPECRCMGASLAVRFLAVY